MKDAFVTIAVNDLRGTREGIVLDWGGTNRPLLPGSQVPGYTTGATTPLGSDKPIGAPVDFSIPLDFNGSDGIFFAPFGVQNQVTLKSNWPDPAFRGAFLPAERSVRADGFEAKWRVSYYGRDYPQQWTGRGGNERFNTKSVYDSRFGAQFLSILDAYRYFERSIKYGVLFLVLVFTTFFLFEDPSVSVSDGRSGALFVLSAAALHFRIHRLRRGIFGRRARIGGADHMVLSIFSRRRSPHFDDRRRFGRCLPFPLHHTSSAGLRAAHGLDCVVCWPGSGHVRDAQS